MFNITKKFSGVLVLDKVNFNLNSGEVHVLLGENGAGKSTLIKIASGIYRKDSGSIFIEGNEKDIINPAVAGNFGLRTVYQELDLVPSLTIKENLFLGTKVPGNFFVNWERMSKEANKIFIKLGVKINPELIVENLSVGQQQLVMIAKTISSKVKILILDEPTAALTDNEVKQLFRVIRILKTQGVGIIYITHRMDEVFEIGDRVTVLRDGRYIGTKDVSDVNADILVSWIVGRDIKNIYPINRKKFIGEVVFELKNLTYKACLNDITFSIKKGEIAGIFGQMGSGASELSRCLVGALSFQEGKTYINFSCCKIKSPKDGINKGIGLLPEDRRRHGLFLIHSVTFNIALTALRKYSKISIINNKKINSKVKKLRDLLDIKTPSLDFLCRNLSGGNQQKVVIAKFLLAGTDILIFSEPTRGIDVGSRVEVYNLIWQLAEEGKSILIISSDLNEVHGLCDTIFVLRKGTIVGNYKKNEVTKSEILSLAMKE